MPSVSQKQHNLFEMVAHDPQAAKRLGIPQSVGKDYVEADKGKSLKSLPMKVGQPKKRKPKGALTEAIHAAMAQHGMEVPE